MKKNVLRWLPHLAALLALVWVWRGISSINPIQDLIQRSGRVAVTFLLASLACRPLSRLGWRAALSLRRPLGLYAFAWASVHVFSWLGLDYGFYWAEIWRQLGEKPFILLGSLTYLILLPLALTSYRWAMKRLGKNWKRLHRSVYLAALLAVVHFGLARKGDFLRLQGDTLLPGLYLLVLLLLLGLRLPRPRRHARTRHPAL